MLCFEKCQGHTDAVIMTADTESPDLCSRKVTDSCPSGHELLKCRYVEGFRCKQCGPLFFQPNENRHKDRCRLRRVCRKPHMLYKDHGSTTRDADCACAKGFHFENEDQRACVPNRHCNKGYGQGEYGVCVKCIDHHMYSDTKDRTEKCKPLTNCQKHSSCLVVKSNGTHDNVCGHKVRNVKSCDDPQPLVSADSADPRLLIACGVASFVLLLLIVVIIFLMRRRSLRRRRHQRHPLSTGQLEELKVKVLKECERDDALCRRVISKSLFVVEERIERQIWKLAQELFRPHPIPGTYELIEEKYKGSQPRSVVNGYLQEWKNWRGESKDTVVELFHCLRRCKRDDIVYEICNGLRQDVDFEADMEVQEDEERTCTVMDDLLEVFCPCVISRGREEKSAPKARVGVTEKELQKDLEACGKLLDVPPPDPPMDPYTAGALYRSRPSPSAPVLDDSFGHDDPAFTDAHFYRQCSQPVQCTT
ncbi:hypothetical protein ACOMHN_000261 [Nucella lapillus]